MDWRRPHARSPERERSRHSSPSRTVEDYIEFFPQNRELTQQVPVVRGLLREIVDRGCLEFQELQPQPSLVMKRAEALLADFNRLRDPSPLAIGSEADLLVEGLLAVRLASFAARWKAEHPGEEPHAARRAARLFPSP